MDAVSILVGGAVGFLVSVGKDWLLEDKKQKEKNKQLKRERLEELHILISHWSNNLLGNGLNLLAVMQEKLDYNQYLDLIIEKEVNYDFQRIEMILNIYASELDETHNKLLELRGELNDIAIKYKHQYESGNFDGEIFIKPYVEIQIKFEKYVNILKNEIANLILKN